MKSKTAEYTVRKNGAHQEYLERRSPGQPDVCMYIRRSSTLPVMYVTLDYLHYKHGEQDYLFPPEMLLPPEKYADEIANSPEEIQTIISTVTAWHATKGLYDFIIFNIRHSRRGTLGSVRLERDGAWKPFNKGRPW